MTIPLGLSPTNTALADKLNQLFHRGTLFDVHQELHLPTFAVADPVRLSKRCTTSPLSIIDSSTSCGLLVLGCAALARRRSFAFRLACFAMTLERGANPFARGTDGRAVSWVLDSVKNPAERQCFVEESQQAKQAWKAGEKYEIAPDIQEWIKQTLALIEEEKREALEQADRETFVQSPQEDEPSAVRASPTATPPPAKRPRLEAPAPAPESRLASQSESLPDYDEVVMGVKAEPVESRLPPPEPPAATQETSPRKRLDGTVVQPAQVSQPSSIAHMPAAPPDPATPVSSRLSRLPPGVVQGPQVHAQPVLKPSFSRPRPGPPPQPLPLAETPTLNVSSASSALSSGAMAVVSASPDPQTPPPGPEITASPAPAATPARKSRLPPSVLGRLPPALRVRTPASTGDAVPLPTQAQLTPPPAAPSSSAALDKESAPPKFSLSVSRLPPTAQNPSSERR